MKMRSKEDLVFQFNKKIDYLKKQIDAAEEYELCSDMRDEYANNIAVVLRTLLCYSSGTVSLCKRCGYDNTLLFGFHSNEAAMNLLPNYDLVVLKTSSIGNNNLLATFSSNDEFIKEKGICSVYLSFRSWMKEVVVDFKSSDCEPISREGIIHIVADRMGAHLDSDIDPYLYKIANDNIFPLEIKCESGYVHIFGKNLFTESIITIAKELFYAVEFSRIAILGKRSLSQKNKCYVQVFNKGMKYVVTKNTVTIYPYNSNSFFSCEIKCMELFDRKLMIHNRSYTVSVIDCDCKQTIFENPFENTQ